VHLHKFIVPTAVAALAASKLRCQNGKKLWWVKERAWRMARKRKQRQKVKM